MPHFELHPTNYTGRFLYTRVIFRHLLYFYHAPTTARVGKNLLASLWEHLFEKNEHPHKRISNCIGR